MPITFVTLGPEGTCHERAVKQYARFQGLEDVELDLITDFFDGLERIRGRDDAFLVQCSAHPGVHEITEKHCDEVFVVDTFIYPTKSLAILSRRDLDGPARSLGIVEATEGYVDLSEWEVKIPQISKPLAAEALLRGEFDAALTHSEWLDRHPEELKLERMIGEIDTTWVVYGTTKRFAGEVIGIPSPDVYGRAAAASALAAA
ncbi:hypothetical protein [Baekduia sp.]|jgi:hypothetical protein|uniref:hypothetical protein n=1 Tax=Baekduia sp. TaxID=2600305 RepID=UPI002E056894|nr:hypothetical protein [Baekduia sp.]